MKRITLNGTKVNFNAVASDKRVDFSVCTHASIYIYIYMCIYIHARRRWLQRNEGVAVVFPPVHTESK